MKHFFISLLAVIVGGIILSLIPLFIIISIVALASSEPKPQVEDNSFLVFDVSMPIAERSIVDPSTIINSTLYGTENSIGLLDAIKNIEKAAVDSRIKGIFIKGESSASSISTMMEVRNALLKFKESGKPIYYYSTSTSQSALYLASVADKIFMSPQGEAQIYGLTSWTTFYKDLFDNIGVEAQAIRHGKFKSAIEPYTMNEMSDASREQMKKLIDSIWDEMRSAISKSRGIDASIIDKYADNYDFAFAQNAVDNHIIDSLIYYDQFVDFLHTKTELSAEKDVPFIKMNKYTNVYVDMNEKLISDNNIAIVYANGEIYDGSDKSDFSNIFADDLSKAIREARKDSTIKAIVLRVNSPGGSAIASDIIWREIEMCHGVKPIVVSMGNYAASGGYYISCAADVILAEPTTITGSIGVFGIVPTAKKLYNKVGLHTNAVTSNKESNLTYYEPLSATQRQYLQNAIEHCYSTFIGRCAQGRNTTSEKIDEIGQGRVWAGIDAKEINLVDKLGGLTDAIKLAAEMANISDDYTLTELPKIDDPMTLLFTQLSSDTKSFVKSLVIDEDELSVLQKLKEMSKYNGKIMTRMEYDIEIAQ